uniref:7-cyano-7-deazaguanine synthase n=1 Tax=Bacillus glycinifermentans TaxID=1664069 RepID=A0A2I7ZJK6_9BACI|nr:7-cyano-7-deazaguanine synthase [Bacillus glycinifermentans]
MTFKKAFNIGYVILLISFVLAYFLLPAKHIFTAVLVLTLIFGVFQIALASKYRVNPLILDTYYS